MVDRDRLAVGRPLAKGACVLRVSGHEGCRRGAECLAAVGVPLSGRRGQEGGPSPKLAGSPGD